ncbi:unnamed protein product [Acanthosepion pharaonis]|uniref:Uncharacterized protein n=1 Tax=Acanthosepion pharaonis TaxID=158019 RepID=A0A812ELY6_ACAPH|nr:unnamed protein product [Sepia pharaonis]
MVLKRLICSLFLFCSSFPAEVLGSYSQLLKSIDEPLFYHSAEEIAFLLSPMACKGGPNQRNSSGWKNGENFSHNRQNQRSAFHPNHSQQVNRNLGYDPQNSSPAQKNSYHNQNFKNNNKQNSNESFLVSFSFSLNIIIDPLYLRGILKCK